ncbi:hypothetical protein FHX03_006398 [Rhizobium sp. BK456]|nr:hypothetical protein [Rhizobium sp. BK456]
MMVAIFASPLQKRNFGYFPPCSRRLPRPSNRSIDCRGCTAARVISPPAGTQLPVRRS